MSSCYSKKRKYDRDVACLFDEVLYRENYESSKLFNKKLFGCINLPQLPPCKYKNIAIYEDLIHGRLRSSLPNSGCNFCINKYDNSIISSSDNVYLVMDLYKSCILENQLIISPFEHFQSTLYLDDCKYTEIRNYQKTLVHMFDELDKVVIFIELSLKDEYLKGNASHSQHFRIECYPISRDLLNEAKCYFLKEIEESGSYWSQNKKIINIKGKNGVRGHIPLGFDYIHVDYSLTGDGIACVIDDYSKVKSTFGKEIIMGILELDALKGAFDTIDDYNKALNRIKKIIVVMIGLKSFQKYFDNLIVHSLIYVLLIYS